MKDKIMNLIGDYLNYILAVLYILGICMMLICYQGFGGLALAVVILFIYWTPYGYGIGVRYADDFASANNCDVSNPLYVRGYFRKSSKCGTIFSELKGFFYCQIISIILFVGIAIYRIINYFINFRNSNIENIFVFCSIGLFIIWIGIRKFYEWHYTKDIQYVQNKDGIWMPFLYLASQPYYGCGKKSSRFYGRIYIKYEEVKHDIRCEMDQKGYIFIKEYIDAGKELSFYIREYEEEIHIFELIHMTKYENKELEYFNDIFIDFWKNHIEKEKWNTSVRFTFLLCVEEETRELKKFLDVCCVYPRSDRCIMPVFMINDEYADYYSIKINSNKVSKKCMGKYNEMQKELIETLGINADYER